MDEQKTVGEIEEFIQDKVDEAGAEGLVIGLSGGIDSATTLKLAVKAVGREKVTALIMPGEPSNEENIADARELADDLGVEKIEIDIEETVEAFKSEVPFDISREAGGNIRARTRMVYSYTAANEKNLLVLGTGNRTEFLLGYFTKYGDGATDIAPLLDLYKTEVRDIARYIGLDEKFIEKKPTAGLWEGQTDEEEIGASYDVADKVLKALIDEGKSVEKVSDDLEVSVEEVESLNDMYLRSEHKREGVQGLEIFSERN